MEAGLRLQPRQHGCAVRHLFLHPDFPFYWHDQHARTATHRLSLFTRSDTTSRRIRTSLSTWRQVVQQTLAFKNSYIYYGHRALPVISVTTAITIAQFTTAITIPQFWFSDNPDAEGEELEIRNRLKPLLVDAVSGRKVLLQVTMDIICMSTLLLPTFNLLIYFHPQLVRQEDYLRAHLRRWLRYLRVTTQRRHRQWMYEARDVSRLKKH